MPGVVIELGAGAARVGSARVAIAPAEGGGLRVGDFVMRPITFAERARVVADARAAGTLDDLGAAVLRQAADARPAVDAAPVLEAIALHLAGARDSGGHLPGFASAVVAMTCGAGWTPAAAVSAPADLLDRLAEAILAGEASDPEAEGWTRIAFAPTTAAPSSDPADVRDSLVADLVRRDAEALSREALRLARLASRETVERAGPGLERPTHRDPAASRALQPEQAAAPALSSARAYDHPESGTHPETAGRSSSASRRIASEPEPVPFAHEASPPTQTVPFPEPIATRGLGVSAHAPGPRFAGAAAATGGGVGEPWAAHGAGSPRRTAFDLVTPLWSDAASGNGISPGGRVTPDARIAEELPRAPGGFDLLALSDALASALDEESDLRGLEET